MYMYVSKRSIWSMGIIIPLCKHVVAKVTLVPCSVNLTSKRDKVGHGAVTINNARIILCSPNRRTLVFERDGEHNNLKTCSNAVHAKYILYR